MNSDTNGQVQNGHIETFEKREKNGKETASKNGRKREENGSPRACKLTDLLDQEVKVGPGHPPKEHQFKPGHPGGPGRPKGSMSIRKMIKAVLYEPEFGGREMAAVVNALFTQAINGNTHAIRLICEQANNRKRGSQPKKAKIAQSN